MFNQSYLSADDFIVRRISCALPYGHVTVRAEPKSVPPHLKRRLLKGEDVISIWFEHAHFEHFKVFDEWLDIKILSPKSKGRSLIGTIDEMTPNQILEFCKSIGVHPAHLIPFDDYPNLSLPTPLLELLVQMMFDDRPYGSAVDDDKHLAKVAVTYEDRRIRKNIEKDRRYAEQTGLLMPLHEVFTQVLQTPEFKKRITNPQLSSFFEKFNIQASPSYSYLERVEDIVALSADEDLSRKSEAVQIKKQIFLGRIEGYVRAYHQVFQEVNEEGRVPAIKFLGDVIDVLSFQGTKPIKASLTQITNAVAKLEPDFNEGMRLLLQSDDQYSCDLCMSIRLLFDAEKALIEAEQNHVAQEGLYILQMNAIKKTFEEPMTETTQRLLNNRVVLAMHNINDTVLYPQRLPK